MAANRVVSLATATRPSRPPHQVGARFIACDERRATYAAGLHTVVAPVWYEPPGGGLQNVT